MNENTLLQIEESGAVRRRKQMWASLLLCRRWANETAADAPAFKTMLRHLRAELLVEAAA